MGDSYEVTGTTVTKYYGGGAMRVGGTLYYLLSDHLGSNSLIIDTAGNVVGETRYTAWGEERYSSGTVSSTHTYTGQYSNTDDFGLMYYKARWYDPVLGRFAQADSIVPCAGNPLAWDRYAYVFNNPITNTDPSGHISCNMDQNGQCDPFEERIMDYLDRIIKQINVVHDDTDRDNDNLPEVADKNASPVPTGSSMGCTESTYTECFYSKELLDINGTLIIDPSQFANLVIAVYYDLNSRTLDPLDQMVYDTPFWDSYGEAPGKVCVSGYCFLRQELNYFAQGMYTAANGDAELLGKMKVVFWKARYLEFPPSAGTRLWFDLGYMFYQEILNEVGQ